MSVKRFPGRKSTKTHSPSVKGVRVFGESRVNFLRNAREYQSSIVLKRVEGDTLNTLGKRSEELRPLARRRSRKRKACAHGDEDVPELRYRGRGVHCKRGRFARGVPRYVADHYDEPCALVRGGRRGRRVAGRIRPADGSAVLLPLIAHGRDARGCHRERGRLPYAHGSGSPAAS